MGDPVLGVESSCAGGWVPTRPASACSPEPAMLGREGALHYLTLNVKLGLGLAAETQKTVK